VLKKFLCWLSGRELRKEIKTIEAVGDTGQTNPGLHDYNCEQTGRLSNQEVQSLIASRLAEGKPVEKLISAARDRGIQIPTSNMSDAALSNAIKEREAHGHTGATDSATHALNCAQTDRLSTSQINSLIESRRAAGLPTGKLEAARRDRG